MQELVTEDVRSDIQVRELDNQKNLVFHLDRIGLDEERIAKELLNIIENAMASDPKWNLIEDFGTKLLAIKTWHQMRKSSPDISINIANVFPSNNLL